MNTLGLRRLVSSPDSSTERQAHDSTAFGLNLPFRPRQTEVSSIPYPQATTLPAHLRLPRYPVDAQSAIKILRQFQKEAGLYVHRSGAASGFSGWTEAALILAAKRLHSILSKNQSSQLRFGIPRVRGFETDKTTGAISTETIEVPMPGWMLRSMGFKGSANSRDIALFFKLVAVCNTYLEAGKTGVEDDGSTANPEVMTWEVPHRKVVGALFRGHVSRLQASLNRLRDTWLTPVDDALNPRLKFDRCSRIVAESVVEGEFLKFSLDRSLCQGVLGQTRYAHVNVRTLATLRSMYGVRCYLLGLGYCAVGAWSRSGGNARVVMKEAEFKSIILNSAHRLDGDFRRDVITQIRLDLGRLNIVTDAETARKPRSYHGKERMLLEVVQNPERNQDFREGFDIKPSCIGLYMSVAEAAVSHSSKHKPDMRVMRWRHKRVTFDLEAIRAERNKSRSLGIAKARADRDRPAGETGGVLRPDTRNAMEPAADLIDKTIIMQCLMCTEGNETSFEDGIEDREPIEADEDMEDIDVAGEEEEINSEGYIFPLEEDE